MDKQLSIGFAQETNIEIEHATEKLKYKNFDMVVLNSINDTRATFDHDTNKVTILKKDSSIHRFPIKHKAEVAKDIVMEAGAIILQKQFCTVERTS